METKRCRSDEESSSSSKFGCFILHTTFFPVMTRRHQFDSEHALLLLTSESDDHHPAEKYISRTKTRTVTDCLSSIVTGCNDDDDDDEQLVLKVKNLGFPLAYKFNSYDKQVVGSCNGLVCLQDRRRAYPFDARPHEVSLWNPATGQFRILPQSLNTGYYGPNVKIAGFGFDFETMDYKVVLFTGLNPAWNGDGPKECFCVVEVYNLSTDSWRILDTIPCLPGYPFYYENVLYLNGICLFLAHFFWTDHRPCLPQNDRFVISFDLTKEIITPIQLPDHDRNQELLLCHLGDKVALFTSPKIFAYTPQIRTHEDFNIWVLNYEQGSSSSSVVNKKFWTKQHTFRIQLAQRPYESYKPRGILNDGKYALLESPAEETVCTPKFQSRKMNLYNLATKELKGDFLPCRKVMCKAVYAYKPSQVSVISSSTSNSSNL